MLTKLHVIVTFQVSLAFLTHGTATTTPCSGVEQLGQLLTFLVTMRFLTQTTAALWTEQHIPPKKY